MARLQHAPWMNAQLALAALAATLCAGARAEGDAPLVWHEVKPAHVEGRLWPEEARLREFDRLPAAAEKTVPKPVWDLSRDATGMVARFRTDATAIHVRVSLMKPQLDKPHMPATGARNVESARLNTSSQFRSTLDR